MTPGQVGTASTVRAEASEGDRPGILLVDDDALVQDAVGAMLDFLGFDPVIASTGEEALARMDDGLRPSMVILDMDMPGLGGAGTLPHLRTRWPATPVLIVTGRVNEKVQELVRGYPGVGLLPKPFNMGELQERLA